MSDWEHLGNAIVDSGRMVVSDPIYAHDRDAVVFQPGRGDGEYPVYALRDSGGRIIEVRIRLTSTDECPAVPPSPPTPYVTVVDGEPRLMLGDESIPKWKLDYWFSDVVDDTPTEDE